MAENKVLKSTASIVSALEQLDDEDRLRAVQAALSILGHGTPTLNTNHAGSGFAASEGSGSMTAQEYFDVKKPKTKAEELATAARKPRCKEMTRHLVGRTGGAVVA